MDLEKLRTARDLVIEGMHNQGLSEAPCVEFILEDGSIIEAVSESHPVLDRPATEVRSMKFKTSAEGGYVYLLNH